MATQQFSVTSGGFRNPINCFALQNYNFLLHLHIWPQRQTDRNISLDKNANWIPYQKTTLVRLSLEIYMQVNFI